MELSSHPLSRLESLCPGAGQSPLDGDPLVAPLIQSTTFPQRGLESENPHAYSRVSNPTVETLERALGDSECALQSVCFASGLAAETALFFATLRAGDHVVCGRCVYGGTTRLLEQVLSEFGVSASFVDPTSLEEFRSALRDNTRLIFAETPANPTLELTDIRGLATIARQAGAILAVDNTFLTPALQQPLDLGADVSVYSTTKFIEGHSVTLGGALTTRDPALRERFHFIRKCTGAVQTPFNAWLTLQGLRTLPLRIRRCSETASVVARWLASLDEVSVVRHSSLSSFPQRELAGLQHAHDLHGGVIAFELEDAEAAQAFVGGLRAIRLVEHVGSVETLITHSASMTHADVDPAQRELCGVSDGLLRLSIGLEPAGAIIADLERGLDALTSAAPVTTNREEASCPALV